MDATWSVGLVWTYFTHPEYLVVQSWVSTTYIFSDTINHTWLQICYVKFFLEMGYMSLGAPCDGFVALTDHSNAAMPFVITAFVAL